MLICVSLAACARDGDEPRPTGTLEPSIIESSSLPTNIPDNNACDLLTAENRAALPGYSMDERVPVEAQPGTEECVWVHSVRRPVRAAIRLIALHARLWASQAASQVYAASRDPRVSRSDAEKLKKARNELIRNAHRLPPERICEIYLLSFEARGFIRDSDLTFFGGMGSMPAAYAISCENGVLTIVGYGEYGLRPSVAVQHAVLRLVNAAADRVPEFFATESDIEDGTASYDDDENLETPSDEPSSAASDTRGDAAGDEADAEDEDES